MPTHAITAFQSDNEKEILFWHCYFFASNQNNNTTEKAP